MAGTARAAGAAIPVAFGGTRLVLGLAMVARPRLLGGLLGADPAATAATGWSTRMLGTRELALGIGTLLLRSEPRQLRRFLAIQAGCDAGDAVFLAAAVRQGRVARGRGLLLALCSAAGAAGDVLAVRRRPPAD